LQQIGDQLAAARQQLAGLDGDALGQELTAAEADLAQLRDVLNHDPLALWQGGRVDTSRIGRLRERAAAAASAARELAEVPGHASARVAAGSAGVSPAAPPAPGAGAPPGR